MRRWTDRLSFSIVRAICLSPIERSLDRLCRPAGASFALVVIAIGGLQVGLGGEMGLAGARVDNAEQIQGARVLVNIDKYPDPFVVSSLGLFQSAKFIRQMAHIAQVHHLSLFGTSAAASYRAEGLVALPAPKVRIGIPMAGAVLRGSEFLPATASDGFTVTRVEFQSTGEGLVNSVISSAGPYQYGWIGSWNTGVVQSGRYVLTCVAFDTAGNEVRSPVVPVTVQNR